MAGPAALALTAVSGYKQYRAQKKAGKAAEQNANINAALQEAQADQDELDAREQIARMRDEGARFLGRQRSVIAASGVVSNEGSPLDIIGETAGRLALEQADLARSAQARKAQGYAQAEETRRTGILQRKGANAAATGTLLSTGASLAGQAINFGQAGVKGFGWAVPNTKTT